ALCARAPPSQPRSPQMATLHHKAMSISAGGTPLRGAPPRRAATSPLDARLPHQLGEALHTLEALLRLLAPKVEDQLADAEPGVGRDVLKHSIGRARERAPHAAGGHARVVEGRLVGDRQRARVAALGLG